MIAVDDRRTPPAWPSPSSGRLGRLLDTGSMLPIATSAVTIGFGMLITFDTDPVDWRGSWWLVPDRPGARRRAVRRPQLRGGAAFGRSDAHRRGDDARRLADAGMAARRRAVPVAPARVRCARSAAAISLGEFGATSFLSRSGGETMPIVIDQLLGRTGSILQAQGYVLATLLAATTIALVAARRARDRRRVRRRTGDRTDQPRYGQARDGAARRRPGHGARSVTESCSTRVAVGRRRARSSPCSGRRAAARARCCKVIAGIVAPDAGRVRIDGVDVTRRPTHRRHVGHGVPGQPAVPAPIGDRQRRVRAADGRSVEHDRHATGRRSGSNASVSPGFGGRDVAALSGGEAKRVALARTMITEPLVVLLDEPLTGLDRELHDRLAADLARPSSRATGTTAVLVTHDVTEAAAIADRTVSRRAAGTLSPTVRRTDVRQGRRAGARRTRTTCGGGCSRDDSPTAEVSFDGDDEPDDVPPRRSNATTRSWPCRRGCDGRSPDRSARHATSSCAGWRPSRRCRARVSAPPLLRRRRSSERTTTGPTSGLGAGPQRPRSRFYVAHGFVAVGDEFVDATTGLPHRIVVVDVPTDASHRPR